jgi:secreted trypsin-like serine protease
LLRKEKRLKGNNYVERALLVAGTLWVENIRNCMLGHGWFHCFKSRKMNFFVVVAWCHQNMFCQVRIANTQATSFSLILFVAAHCFQVKYTFDGDKKAPQEVTVWVGRHNLDKANESRAVEHEVWDLILHEDWDYTSNDFDADIALIVLETEVDLKKRFTVGVVCLPAASQAEVSGIGIIAGWGASKRSEANQEPHDSTPNELELPAVTKAECVEADYRLDILLTDRNFCAGFVNQNKSACVGDSGGGFVQYDKSTKAYSITGIVSSSLKDNVGSCRIDLYSVFTDVTKFTDWINLNMEETMDIKWINVDFECVK